MTASIQELFAERGASRIEYPCNRRIRKSGRAYRRTGAPQKGKLVTSGMGKAGQIAMNIATTFCSTGIPSVFLHPSEAQHGGFRHPAGKRPAVAHFQFWQNARNCRVDPIGTQPESQSEIHRHHRQSGQSAGTGIRCMPQHRKSQRGLHIRHDAHHLHNGHDRNR